jgi:hypothetical protein
MISDTSEEETNCLSFSHDWNPTTGGTAISHDNSITWNLEETSGARIDNYKTTIIPEFEHEEMVDPDTGETVVDSTGATVYVETPASFDTSETKISNEVE